VINAAVTPRRCEETPEGIELQFATNVMGYFWLIQAFSDRLKESVSARVVNVASYWAGNMENNWCLTAACGWPNAIIQFPHTLSGFLKNFSDLS